MGFKDTFLNTKSLLNTGGYLSNSNKHVWGILNLTPDSFYDGGLNFDLKKALVHTEKMLLEGADVIDVGGASSKPGALSISEEEEIKRIQLYLKEAILQFKGIKISVDTFNSNVAEFALDHGAQIINDISGGVLDPNMFSIVKKYNAPIVLMHMRGNPQNMQSHCNYNNVNQEVIIELNERINLAKSHNIHDIIIDPGFGFSKTIDQNFKLLNELELFKTFGLPLLVGISRKSMIYKTLNIDPKESLNGTTALNTIALLKGADILRVHDVKEAKEIINLVNNLNS